MVGSRTPAKLADWVSEVGDAGSAGTFAEAASFGELNVLPCFGAGAGDALAPAGPSNLEEKVLIDTPNPLVFVDGSPQLFVGHTDSLGERVQRWIPAARIVKAFNTVNNALMADPDVPGGPPTMFLCGNAADAKATAGAIPGA